MRPSKLVRIVLTFAVAALVCLGASPGSGPDLSVLRDLPIHHSGELPKRNRIDQTSAEAALN